MSATPVITGIGVAAPTGVGADEHWKSTLDRKGRIAPITGFDTTGAPVRLAGQLPGFDGDEHVGHRERVQTDRWTWLAFAAGELAFADAALDPGRGAADRLSVITAAGSGGNAFGQREIQALWRDGPEAVSAYQSIGWFYAASSGQLSIKHQLKGTCSVVVADAAGGLDALGQAIRLLGDGGTDAVLTGGTEAPLSPYALACQAERPMHRGTDPATGYRPFHQDADGFLPGEGGAMLVLETAEAAAARGVVPYAEVLATAATHDAHHPVDPPPDAGQFARAMRLAIEEAGLRPDEIGAVFADAAGSPAWDRLEAAAIRQVFGARPVPVAVPKTMTGRLCSGQASLDLSWAALALTHGVLPPSVHLDDADPAAGGLDLVTTAREAPELRAVLVLARGSGGFNSAAVLGKHEGGRR